MFSNSITIEICQISDVYIWRYSICYAKMLNIKYDEETLNWRSDILVISILNLQYYLTLNGELTLGNRIKGKH